MNPRIENISIRVKLAVLTAGIIAAVVLGRSIHSLVREVVLVQEEITLESRLMLVSLAGAVGSLWTDDRVPDLEPFAKRFEGRFDLRSLAVLSPDGKVLGHVGIPPTAEEIRMVTRLRLRTVPRTIFGLGTGPIEVAIATPVMRGNTLHGYLLCALRTNEAATRIRQLISWALIEALLWIAIGSGVTLWLTGRITRPLTELADDLLHLGKGVYRVPQDGRAGGEIGIVQDRLVELSGMLEHERSQVSELTGKLHHQINVISAGLETRAAELSAVLDSARDAILVVAVDGQVLRKNEPARLFFGETLQQKLWERVENPKALQHAIEHACATQSPSLVHTRICSGDPGQWLPLRVRVTPLRSTAQVLDALVVVAEDLSDSQKLTEHMMRSERLASMATLTAGMAHQLGNHLNAIKGYAALLERQLSGADESIQADLAAIAREVRAAGAMLQRTQELARTHHHTQMEFTLGELLHGVCDRAAIAASSSSVDIQLEILDESLPLAGDPELLQEALLNLVINGIQAMPQGGELRLRGQERARNALITVADTGEGIPDSVRSRIFDPFYTTKEPGEGTGLGLAIANHIVELHDGQINIKSQVGQGTIFEVLLPIRRAAAEPSTAQETSTEVNSEVGQ